MKPPFSELRKPGKQNATFYSFLWWNGKYSKINLNSQMFIDVLLLPFVWLDHCGNHYI